MPWTTSLPLQDSTSTCTCAPCVGVAASFGVALIALGISTARNAGLLLNSRSACQRRLRTPQQPRTLLKMDRSPKFCAHRAETPSVLPLLPCSRPTRSSMWSSSRLAGELPFQRAQDTVTAALCAACRRRCRMHLAHQVLQNQSPDEINFFEPLNMQSSEWRSDAGSHKELWGWDLHPPDLRGSSA